MYPTNVTLLLESEGEGVFKCCHRSLDHDINWRVNGSVVGRFVNIITQGSISDNGSFVHTLTIPARSEYNGTEVVCQASLDGSMSERTPTAKLLVMRGGSES